MKLGDAVKIAKPKLYQQNLIDVVGIIVEHFPQRDPPYPPGKAICRVLWPDGSIDKTWRLCKELEVINESR